MLAKKYRLTDSRDFRKVQDTGTTFQSASFGIAILDRHDTDPTRFAVIISTKVAKDAVDRNTVRRHITETVRLMTNYIKDGRDVVFLAKTSIIRIPAEALVREVRTAIKDSGLLKQEV
jgi:ribonuclease P protein component